MYKSGCFVPDKESDRLGQQDRLAHVWAGMWTQHSVQGQLQRLRPGGGYSTGSEFPGLNCLMTFPKGWPPFPPVHCVPTGQLARYNEEKKITESDSLSIKVIFDKL